MAEDENKVEFIGAEEYRGQQNIPFNFIIGRILINLDTARFTMNERAYVAGVDTLIQRCWHLIDKENSRWKRQLLEIDDKYNKLSKDKNISVQELQFERAKEIERLLMKLLYSSGEVTEFMEE